MNPTNDLDIARAALARADPVMARLIDDLPPIDPDAFRKSLGIDDLFEALVYQIVGQQISVAALNAIFGRLRGSCEDGRLRAATLADHDVEALRALGMSRQKARYIIRIAQYAVEGGLEGLGDLPHAEARARLLTLPGVGAWTADGALLLAFGAGDVLLSGDLVIRKAVKRAYRLPDLPSVDDVDTLGQSWRPYRSLAAAYLWRLMETG